jgi:energy-coupling factor transporter ATP-binding protein EcfA2
MRVTVRNLGVINEAEIDLKPLTIFVGPNNSGKTWLAYTIAGLLGQYGSSQYLSAYIDEKVNDTYPTLDKAIGDVLNEGNTKIDLIQFAEEFAETYFANIARIAPQWMPDFMGTDKASFDRFEANIQLLETRPMFLEELLRRPVNNRLSVGQGGRGPLLSILKESGKRDLYMYTATEGDITAKIPYRAIKEFLARLVFECLYTALYYDMFAFPTERTAYVSFRSNTSNLIGGARIIRESAGQRSYSIPLPWPVNHFNNLMDRLYGRGMTLRKKEAQGSPQVTEYIQLAEMLAAHILGGDLDFSTPEPDPMREIIFKPKNNVTLDMPVVSSMVKELAPLVLYLRYIAWPEELLVIDEPEMNLHPEAQAQLIELLAMLVNAGLRILVTTHSTYIVDHLINLMEAAKHEDKTAIAELFFLERTDAFLHKENVSVYLIDPEKEKQAESILDENGIIHWNTFSDVTNRVENIHFKL